MQIQALARQFMQRMAAAGARKYRTKRRPMYRRPRAVYTRRFKRR